MSGIPRNRRIADLIQREISQLLYLEARDPRFKQVVVNAVKVSDDLSAAYVYVEIKKKEERDKILTALNAATGFFRSRLAKNIHIKRTPSITFSLDKTAEHTQRISDLLSNVEIKNSSDDEESE